MNDSARKRLCKRLRENTENPLVCGAAADWIELQHVLLGDKAKEIGRLKELLKEDTKFGEYDDDRKIQMAMAKS